MAATDPAVAARRVHSAAAGDRAEAVARGRRLAGFAGENILLPGDACKEAALKMCRQDSAVADGLEVRGSVFLNVSESIQADGVRILGRKTLASALRLNRQEQWALYPVSLETDCRRPNRRILYRQAPRRRAF